MTAEFAEQKLQQLVDSVVYKNKVSAGGKEFVPVTDLEASIVNFNDLDIKTKVQVLFELWEAFLPNENCKEALEQFEIEDLRKEAFGKDAKGHTYWYFHGVRLYREKKPTPNKRKKLPNLFEPFENAPKSNYLKNLQAKKSKKVNAFKNITLNGRPIPKSLKKAPSILLDRCDALVIKLAKQRQKEETVEVDEQPKAGRWELICQTEEDWTKLADSFKESKSTNEIALRKLLVDTFLPVITASFAKLEVKKRLDERRRKFELMPKRTSSRVVLIRTKQEQEAHEAQKRELEELQEQEEKARKEEAKSRSELQLKRSLSDAQEEKHVEPKSRSERFSKRSLLVAGEESQSGNRSLRIRTCNDNRQDVKRNSLPSLRAELVAEDSFVKKTPSRQSSRSMSSRLAGSDICDHNMIDDSFERASRRNLPPSSDCSNVSTKENGTPPKAERGFFSSPSIMTIPKVLRSGIKSTFGW